jgi:hypothetical protein
MWQRYVHVTAEQMNEEIFAGAGVVEDDDSLSRERQRCGNCRETLAPTAHWCPNCGEPATKEARDEKQAGVESLTSGIDTVRDDGRVYGLSQGLRLINADPSKLGHADIPPDASVDSDSRGSSTESMNR